MLCRPDGKPPAAMPPPARIHPENPASSDLSSRPGSAQACGPMWWYGRRGMIAEPLPHSAHCRRRAPAAPTATERKALETWSRTVGRTESSLRDSRTYWLQLQSSAVTGRCNSPLARHSTVSSLTLVNSSSLTVSLTSAAELQCH